MNCPLCKADTVVLHTDDNDRRRRCTSCDHRFTTTEVLKAELERSNRLIEEAKALAERIRSEA